MDEPCYKVLAMSLGAYLRGALQDLGAQGILRAREPHSEAGAGLINVCANDYLGYAAEHVSRETPGSGGAGASRLIHGTHPAHEALERELAEWVGMQDALVFSSGYAANVGVVSALAESDDLIVSDELNHASIIDGCRLSRARVAVVKHRDLRGFETALRQPARAKWVVTESYFSMDGDSPDLVRLRSICDSAAAFLVVDEAHALGVFGSGGAGLCSAHSVQPDVIIGTLGKAVGLQGAFVAGPTELTQFLWNRARSFVFSTAVSPALAHWTLTAVRRTRADEPGRDHLRSLIAQLDRALAEAGVALPASRHGPIFPVVLGTPERAVRAALELRSRGFLVQPIRPPTVPVGTSRLRVALSARLGVAVVDQLAAALRDICSGS